MTHNEVVDSAAYWLSGRTSYPSDKYNYLACDVVLPEPCGHYFYGNVGKPDVYGFTKNKSINIECKATLTDFKADKKKKHEHPLGNYKIYACPKGLINPIDVPNGWGLLYIGKHQNKLIKEPIYFEEGLNYSYEALHDILINLKLHGDLNYKYLRRPRDERGRVKMFDGKSVYIRKEND